MRLFQLIFGGAAAVGIVSDVVSESRVTEMKEMHDKTGSAHRQSDSCGDESDKWREWLVERLEAM